ncbi:hypothetical protein [Robertmurraya sp. P23]|uniref:hypothetical protein n=1 Tax=Robertmurraya sp. P23 TaxID=3436931 RepID=UPI003D966138
MKKIYTIYLTGFMIIFSYIFTYSIYEIYGLNNLGDTSLSQYEIKYNSGEELIKVYNGLIEEDAVFQIVKNPMSEDKNTYYDIYHTDINSVKKFVGISNNVYRYFQMTVDEFGDSNGYFYTNLSYDNIFGISQAAGVEISPVSGKKLSYSNIFANNFLQFLILGVTTLTILYIYTIFRYKTNAVKKLAGFSPSKIVFTNIRETIIIEGILITVLIVGYSVYFWLNDKFSWTYVIFLFLFLLLISIITMLLLLLLQHFIRKIDIVDVLKNKVFSIRLYIILFIIKIMLIVAVTFVMNIGLNYYGQLNEAYKKTDEYKILDKLYSSHGRNSDEYDKLINNPDKLEEIANNVKEMYLKNNDQAYVMFDPVRETFHEQFLAMLGMTREEIMNSYERNYVILNKNYIEEYTDVEVEWNFDEKLPTILVPEKYREFEGDIKEIYVEMYNSSLNYNTRYGIEVEEVRITDIQIIYIKNGFKYKILSSIPYENEVDIELTDSIIVLDNGSFGSGFYYDMLGASELAFQLKDRDEFKNLLIQYDLNNLYMANTLLTPFESVISSYKFLLDQTKLFVFLFTILLIFIIYISNFIDMIVNGKIYATRYVLGYPTLGNLRMNIIITIVLLGVAITLFILKINIIIFLMFILYDLITMLYLYKRLIVNQLDKVLNGGH